MGTASRVGGFGAALALVLAGGWALGSTLGPTVGAPGPAVVDTFPAGGAHATDAPADATHAGAPGTDPEAATAGLSSTRAGYTLAPTATVLPWKQPTQVGFTITGSDGAPVRAFDRAASPDGGAARMDAAVIRRDDAGYTRLRATLGPDGVWRAPVTFPGAGVWRLYAGFTPSGGPPLQLGVDIYVPGPFGPFTFTGQQRGAQAGAYRVRLDGALLPGGDSRLFATVSRDGAPVTDLQPMAGGGGVFGRMVAVRQGDLARFPLRAEVSGAAPGARSGPGVAFVADVPSAGSYRLFLTFTHDGAEHACEFTVGTPTGS